jgi:hypothetical protein
MDWETCEITGKVYWDFNQDGQYDSGEEITDAAGTVTAHA